MAKLRYDPAFIDNMDAALARAYQGLMDAANPKGINLYSDKILEYHNRLSEYLKMVHINDD